MVWRASSNGLIVSIQECGRLEGAAAGALSTGPCIASASPALQSVGLWLRVFLHWTQICFLACRFANDTLHYEQARKDRAGVRCAMKGHVKWDW